MVPLLFFTALVAGIALSILLPYVWIAFVAVSGLYGLAALYFAGRHSAGRMKAGIVIAPFFFFMLHASYGLGSLCAAVKLIFLKRKWNG